MPLPLSGPASPMASSSPIPSTTARPELTGPFSAPSRAPFAFAAGTAPSPFCTIFANTPPSSQPCFASASAPPPLAAVSTNTPGTPVASSNLQADAAPFQSTTQQSATTAQIAETSSPATQRHAVTAPATKTSPARPSFEPPSSSALTKTDTAPRIKVESEEGQRVLFETGEWSDVLVQTAGTQEYNLHRVKLCPASPWFKRFCENYPAARTVVMTEPPEVAEVILRHIYNMQPQILEASLPLPRSPAGAPLHDDLMEHLRKLVELRQAAAKYELHDLTEATRKALATKLRACGYAPRVIVGTATQIYLTTTEADKEDRIIAISAVVGTLDAIMSFKAAWSKLLECPDLNRDVVRMTAALMKERGLVREPSLTARAEEDTQMTGVEAEQRRGEKRVGPELQKETKKKARKESV